jgi:hypothetical protein
MIVKGNLRKMSARVDEYNNVHYQLNLIGNDISLNELVGKQLQVKYLCVINCEACGAVTKKSYAQGFCFSCMQTAPEADDCVLRPLLCKAHLGIARDLEWANERCLKPHYVYLANTGEVKVGVTRESQIPTRWVDQGATSAIKLCKTPNRHIAGLIESFLSTEFSDKTNWKKMITNDVNQRIDLYLLRDKALNLLPEELSNYRYNEATIQNFNYPVNYFPSNPKTINLETEPVLSGLLTGIKGQYLLFDGNRVINVRRHTGFLVEVSY